MSNEPIAPLNSQPDNAGWATAFARLPLENAERSAWPALRMHLRARRQRQRKRRLWVMAAAMGLLAVLAAPLGQRLIDDPSSVHGGETAANALKPLLIESGRLESLIAATAGDSTQGAWIALSTDLEDRLGRIDVALSGTDDPQRQLVLWRERVDLLRELAVLSGTDRWRAAQGEPGLDGALVVAW